MSASPETRLRRLCLAFPQAIEKEAWGAPTFRAGPKGKIFAMFSDDHHGDGHVAAWVPAPPGLQEVLIADDPGCYFKPAYVGPRGWIGIELSRIKDKKLKEHLREAFLQVATKKIASELED